MFGAEAHTVFSRLWLSIKLLHFYLIPRLSILQPSFLCVYLRLWLSVFRVIFVEVPPVTFSYVHLS